MLFYLLSFSLGAEKHKMRAIALDILHATYQAVFLSDIGKLPTTVVNTQILNGGPILTWHNVLVS